MDNIDLEIIQELMDKASNAGKACLARTLKKAYGILRSDLNAEYTERIFRKLEHEHKKEESVLRDGRNHS